MCHYKISMVTDREAAGIRLIKSYARKVGYKVNSGSRHLHVTSAESGGMGDHNDTGTMGEELAADFLKRNGYEVLSRNFRYRRCEIDIVARRGDWLLFIEVKTRSNVGYGKPEEFVHALQSARIMEAAEEYILSINWQGNIRFDIISVVMGARTEIIHFKDAIN